MLEMPKSLPESSPKIIEKSPCIAHCPMVEVCMLNEEQRRKATMKVDSKTQVKITDPLEMVGFIRTNGTRCQFVSMLTVTAPKLKKGCPFEGVKKYSRRNGLLNVQYNAAVRRNIAKTLGVPMADVEYENGQVWYVHQTTTDGKALPLVVNKTKQDGKFYLQYYPMRSAGTVYRLPNGETVEEETLKPWFYAKSKRDEYKPRVVCFDVANIAELRASQVIIETDKTAQAQVIIGQND